MTFTLIFFLFFYFLKHFRRAPVSVVIELVEIFSLHFHGGVCWSLRIDGVCAATLNECGAEDPYH